MKPATLINDERGMATSLIEVVVVVAIVAVISSVALAAAMDKLEDAKISRAMADVQTIGISIHSFMHDTGLAPVFRSGDAHSPNDPMFLVLETAGNAPSADSELNWPTEPGDRDRLEHQLITNRPNETGAPYPRIGQISWARFKGWNGPYTTAMPSSDPWGDRYLVNAQMMTAQGISMASETLTLGIGQRPAVYVISAGPNRAIETRFDQIADAFVAGGDDVIYRIQ